MSRSASTSSTTHLQNAHKTHCILHHHHCLASNHRNYHQQIFPPNLMRWEKKTPTANCGLFSLLCLGCQQHSPKSTQHHSTTHCKCNKTHWTIGPSHSWLPCHPSNCNYLLLGEWHDASYLNESQAWSSYARYFCGDHKQDHNSLTLYGTIFINASIFKLVAASATKAELGALFHNSQSIQELWLSPMKWDWHKCYGHHQWQHNSRWHC